MNGIYASHIRNEENKVVDAINEAIHIGKEAFIPVQISHFKVSARANWGRSTETLKLIENARKQGYDVTIDQYPYTASSTNLGIRLPDWALSGGQDSLVKRINDPKQHKKIIQGMLEQLHSYKYKDYSFAVVANHSADPSYNGKSITEINKIKGRIANINQEAETILDIMKAGGAQMVYHGMNETDVQTFIKYPFNMIGADAGVPIPFKSLPHPRAYGTNARVLARYVREQKLITQEEAVSYTHLSRLIFFGHLGYFPDVIRSRPATATNNIDQSKFKVFFNLIGHFFRRLIILTKFIRKACIRMC